MERRYTIEETLEIGFQGTIEDLKNIVHRVENGDLADKSFTHWSVEGSTDCPDYSVLYLERRQYETDEEYCTRREAVLNNFCNSYFNARTKIVNAMRNQGFSDSEICRTLGLPFPD